MKNLLLILCLAFSGVSFAQSSEVANTFKETDPETYQALQEFAQNKWSRDPELVEQEINNQAASLFIVMKILTDYPNDKELTDWVMDAIENNSNGVLNDNITINNTVDWQEVVKEVNQKLGS